MDKKEALTAAFVACIEATDNNYEVFKQAFEAIHGPKPERVHGGSQELTDWLTKFNPFFKLIAADGYMDAAMLLGKGLPWLAPVIHYADHTTRLVNGLSLPISGRDYLARANTMPLAMAASWLKAHASQIQSPDFVIEVGKTYITKNNLSVKITGIIPEGTSAYEQGYRFVGGMSGQYFSETGKTYPQEEESNPFDLIKEAPFPNYQVTEPV